MAVDPDKLGRFGLGDLAKAVDLIADIVFAEVRSRGCTLPDAELREVRSLAIGLVNGVYESTVRVERAAQGADRVVVPPACYDVAAAIAEDAVAEIAAGGPGLQPHFAAVLRVSFTTGLAAAMMTEAATGGYLDVEGAGALEAAAATTRRLATALRPFAAMGEALLSEAGRRTFCDCREVLRVYPTGAAPSPGDPVLQVGMLREAALALRGESA